MSQWQLQLAGHNEHFVCIKNMKHNLCSVLTSLSAIDSKSIKQRRYRLVLPHNYRITGLYATQHSAAHSPCLIYAVYRTATKSSFTDWKSRGKGIGNVPDSLSNIILSQEVITKSLHRPEAKCCSAAKELPECYGINVHYLVDKGPTLVPVLSKMNPVHTLPFYFFTTESIIIFPWSLLPSSDVPAAASPMWISHAIVFITLHATCSTHLTILDLSIP